MTEFRLPELGENIEAGDVTRVLVAVGDRIARDQPVLELETDKATVEVPSTLAGVVTDIRVEAGETIKVGSVVLTVEESGAASESPTTAAELPPPDVAAPAPQRLSPRPVDSPPVQRLDPKIVSMPRPPRPVPEPERPLSTALTPGPAHGQTAPASPSVRRLARELGVDVNEVEGTAPGGRISLEDVKEHARRIVRGLDVPGRGRGAQAPPLPDLEKWGAVERQAMSNIRRTTSERLSHAWSTIPHVTQCDKADITAMEELRKRYREQVLIAGGALTVTTLLVKVLATAVQHFPQFNASLDPEKGEIVYKKYINIGVAVDTDRGLLVPVIRNADQKNLTQIAVEMHAAAEKARNRKLTLDDMSGGGMTISNLGGIGGTYFTPIVNWPEVAILGVSRGTIEPVWNAGRNTFEPRQFLPLSLSYDHRVIDGADAMRFLRWIVGAIEQPFLLSLIG